GGARRRPASRRSARTPRAAPPPRTARADRAVARSGRDRPRARRKRRVGRALRVHGGRARRGGGAGDQGRPRGVFAQIRRENAVARGDPGVARRARRGGAGAPPTVVGRGAARGRGRADRVNVRGGRATPLGSRTAEAAPLALTLAVL